MNEESAQMESEVDEFGDFPDFEVSDSQESSQKVEAVKSEVIEVDAEVKEQAEVEGQDRESYSDDQDREGYSEETTPILENHAVPVVASEIEPQATEPEPEIIAEPEPQASEPSPPVKQKRKVLTPKERFMKSMLRRAGVESVPAIDEVMSINQEGSDTKMMIEDIGIFIEKPSDGILGEVYEGCSNKNRINLSAKVELNRVKEVGAAILHSGKMYSSIELAKLPDGSIECWSGRHRLVLLAMIYGADALVNVSIKSMTMNEARDAVVAANMARKTRALEKAEHAVLNSVHGDVDADLDTMYTNLVKTKAKAKKYCTYVVTERSYPASIDFSVSPMPTRKQGELTTISNIEGFWGNALFWQKDTPRLEFDRDLKQSIEFLNSLIESMQIVDGFDAKQHLSAMTVCAIGSYYRTLVDANVDIDGNVINDIASNIIEMGDIGREKSQKTYAALTKAMRG